mmetsp:Transcript_20561/g.35461  ORF Transcript_20561/g.35461 Transcript_20561/m.35461 type:complete len:435 (-) Transcript_20561:202-1506(-)
MDTVSSEPNFTDIDNPSPSTSKFGVALSINATTDTNDADNFFSIDSPSKGSPGDRNRDRDRDQGHMTTNQATSLSSKQQIYDDVLSFAGEVRLSDRDEHDVGVDSIATRKSSSLFADTNRSMARPVKSLNSLKTSSSTHFETSPKYRVFPSSNNLSSSQNNINQDGGIDSTESSAENLSGLNGESNNPSNPNTNRSSAKNIPSSVASSRLYSRSRLSFKSISSIGSIVDESLGTAVHSSPRGTFGVDEFAEANGTEDLRIVSVEWVRDPPRQRKHSRTFSAFHGGRDSLASQQSPYVSGNYSVHGGGTNNSSRRQSVANSLSNGGEIPSEPANTPSQSTQPKTQETPQSEQPQQHSHHQLRFFIQPDENEAGTSVSGRKQANAKPKPRISGSELFRRFFGGGHSATGNKADDSQASSSVAPTSAVTDTTVNEAG